MRGVLCVCAVLLSACGAAVQVPVLRPALINGAAFGNTYELRGFSVAQQPAVVAVPTVAPTPQGTPLVEVRLALPGLQNSVDQSWEQPVLETSVETAQRLDGGLRVALQASPNPNQRLVAAGGGLVVQGTIVQSDYREHWRRYASSCRRTVNNRTMEYPCHRLDLRGVATVRIRFVVQATAQRNLFDQELIETTSSEANGFEALDGSPSSRPTLNGAAMMNQVQEQMLTRLSHLLVPWRETLVIDWLDASEFPNANPAREAAREGRFVEAERILNNLLGGAGRPRLSINGGVPRLLANRSAVRLAMGRYSEALQDMELAVDALPGCIASERIEQTRQLAQQQQQLRAQGAAE